MLNVSSLEIVVVAAAIITFVVMPVLLARRAERQRRRAALVPVPSLEDEEPSGRQSATPAALEGSRATDNEPEQIEIWETGTYAADHRHSPPVVHQATPEPPSTATPPSDDPAPSTDPDREKSGGDP